MKSRRYLGLLLIGLGLLMPVMGWAELLSVGPATALAGGLAFVLLSFRSPRADGAGEGAADGSTGPAFSAAELSSSHPARRSRGQRFHSGNVLEMAGEHCSLWRFSVNNGKVGLEGESTAGSGQPLPARWITRDWRSLWQPTLNLAWLPADQVFLRVLELPAANQAELVSMVELQLEKISPLPVAQIVWTVEPYSSGAGQNPAAIVIMAPRNRVEEYLGKLESRGFLADRLDLPLVHEMLAAPRSGSGLSVYTDAAPDASRCLAAWWHEGRLQSLNLLPVDPSPQWAPVLFEQLTQIAWAGEIEGWVETPVQCELVATPEMASRWAPALEEWSGQPVAVREPMARPALAALNLERIARQETHGNLLPAEHVSRYRQEFIDRLWMRGLAAVVVVYLAGVAAYLLAVQVVHFQKSRLETRIEALGESYRQAMQLKARVQALQDRVNLKYAALESWKAAATLLPTDLRLTDLIFDKGRTLTIHGLAPADQVSQIIDYNQSISQYRIEDGDHASLFAKVNPYNSTPRPGPGGVAMVAWNFTCELKRTELE